MDCTVKPRAGRAIRYILRYIFLRIKRNDRIEFRPGNFAAGHLTQHANSP
jgi:hypothetical protein